VRVRKQATLRLASIVMLVITLNNVFAIEHALSIGQGSAHATAEAGQPPPDGGIVKKTHRHKNGRLHTHTKAVQKPSTVLANADPAKTADDGHSHVHVQHCHISPSTCSEQPIPTGPGQMLFSEPLLRTVGLQLEIAERATTKQAAISIDPLTPPPRRA
jgi:hypothetical protein